MHDALHVLLVRVRGVEMRLNERGRLRGFQISMIIALGVIYMSARHKAGVSIIIIATK